MALLGGSWEFAHQVYMCLVHLEKAYNCVPWRELWGFLWRYGVLGPLLQAIETLYNQSESCVHVLRTKSNMFQVGVGLHQGCPLSPILFVIFIETAVVRRVSGSGISELHLCSLQMMWFCWFLWPVTSSQHRGSLQLKAEKLRGVVQ